MEALRYHSTNFNDISTFSFRIQASLPLLNHFDTLTECIENGIDTLLILYCSCIETWFLVSKHGTEVLHPFDKNRYNILVSKWLWCVPCLIKISIKPPEACYWCSVEFGIEIENIFDYMLKNPLSNTCSVAFSLVLTIAILSKFKILGFYIPLPAETLRFLHWQPNKYYQEYKPSRVICALFHCNYNNQQNLICAN